MEGNSIDPEKTQTILSTLREHLTAAFPNLSITLPHNQIRNDTAGNISMVFPLPSKDEPTSNSEKGYINMGLPLDTPTFMLQLTPMAIISDEDYPPPSSRSFIDISVATYHGVILKKDSLVFYIDYKTPGEAELRTSSCELLTKLELFQGGFRLCAGLDSTTGLSINDVFIEPFGEFKDKHVVIRSRKCEFMLEMEEMYSTEKIELDRASCVQCGLLQNDAICLKVESNRNEFQVDEESDHYEKEEPEEILGLGDDSNLIKDPNWRIPANSKKSIDTFASPEFTRKNLREITSKLNCNKCGRKFRNEIIWQSHQDKCTGTKTEDQTGVKIRRKRNSATTNKSAPKSKKAKTELDGNSGVLSDKEIQYCHLCFREFTMSTRFELHMELHRKRMPELFLESPCPFEGCELTFPDRISLGKHYDIHSKKSSPCGYCQKIIKKEKMRSHFFAEHPYQKFVCQICNKVCSFQSQLKQHTQEAHSSVKPKDVVCDICGNRYRREAGLRQHMASAHTQFREFKCSICFKGFTTKARLTQHHRIHTGHKPFKCAKCDYRSNRSDNVLFHLRKVHKVERPTKDEHVLVQNQLLEDEDHISNIETIETKIETVLGDQATGHEPHLATLIVSEVITA